MLSAKGEQLIRVSPISLDDVLSMVELKQLQSAVGHKETASILSEMFGVDVPFARKTVLMDPGDAAIVAQYIGPRLPEGATTLPKGASIEFRLVEILR